MAGGRGGARANTGPKPLALRHGASRGANPFAIAEDGRARKVARTADDAGEMGGSAEISFEETDWTCSACTFIHDTPCNRVLRECAICEAVRDAAAADEDCQMDFEGDSQPPTNAEVASGAAAAAAPMTADRALEGVAGAAVVQGDAGVLKLAGLFTTLLRQFFVGIFSWFEKICAAQRRLFREDFALYEARMKELEARVDAKSTEVENKLKLVDNNTTVRDFSKYTEHICQNGRGDLYCDACSEHAHLVGDARLTRTPWIKGSELFLSNPVNILDDANKLRRSVTSHFEESQLHQQCAAEAASPARQSTVLEGFESVSRLEHEAMSHLFKIAMHIAKHKGSFLEYERLVYLCDAVGAEVGQREHSRMTAKSMLVVSAQVGAESIFKFLTTINPLMNHKPHVTWKADKACDAAGRQFEIVNIRVNYKGTPVQLHLGITPIDGSYTDGGGGGGASPEAGSLVCFNKILEMLEHYGIVMIKAPEGSKRANVSVYEHKDFPGVGVGIAEQVRAGAADGEACYNGTGDDNVKALFKDPVRGYGDTTHNMTHDPSHAVDLLKADGNKAVAGNYVVNVVHKNVRAVYAHYSTSPKRLRGLLGLCEKWGVRFDQLHYLFEVRFIASEVLVFEHFLTDLPAIVLHLKEELQDDDASGEVKAKIKGWLDKITQFKFVSTLITQLDIDSALKEFSVRVFTVNIFLVKRQDVTLGARPE